MDIAPVEDLAALQAFHSVEVATHDADFVALPADQLEELVPLLDGKPRAGELTRMHVATDAGTAVGTVSISLPQLDNLTSANVSVGVHPERRRRGIGRTLWDFALEEVRRAGRRRVFVEAHWGPGETDGPAFSLLRGAGARQVLDDYRRLLDLAQHPVGEVHPVADGYRVVQWVDVAPDQVVEGCAYLSGRMTLDAPMGEMDYEQEKWDAARYRAKEQAAMERKRTRVASAVVHEATGQVAGITDIGVQRGRSQIAFQWDTIVDPDHRGHRLGMVLKTWNHRYLVEQVPGVTHINTWNAASNTFMVAVNDALGFEIAERWSEWQLDLRDEGS